MIKDETISEFMDDSFFSTFDMSFEKPNKLLVELLKIFNVIADGVLVTDPDDMVILINKNHQLLNFTSPDRILGRSAFDLTREGIWSKATEFDVGQLKTDLKPRDYIMVTKQGQELILTGTPVLNDKGKLAWCVFTSRDVGKINDLGNKLRANRILPSANVNHLNNCEGAEMVCASPSMKEVLSIIKKVSKTNSFVFLMGESGVGKDRIARQIHNMSPWSNHNFVQINCASIPESLFESELFGYEKGSFTGARNEGKIGIMEYANGGTLYLDEITEMAPTLQAKLLQVLQERNFRRIGGTANINFNARVISSTNRDIEEIINGKGFRQDLFYRLCVIPIFISPLRERNEDVREFIDVFMKEYNCKHGQHKVLNDDVIDILLTYPWPGNVRELQHVIERLVIMTHTEKITKTDYSNINKVMQPRLSQNEDFLKESVEKVEIDLIKRSLANNKNTRDAAKAIGISQATFLRKAKKYNIALFN